MAMGTVLMTSQSQTHVEEGLQNSVVVRFV